MPIDPPCNVWRDIVVVHNHTKTISLLAEEMDRDFKNYFHPIKEQRDALEHIVRAKAQMLGIISNPPIESEQAAFALIYDDKKPPDYIERCLDKALGHEYRAFFDAADWFSVRLRELICKALNEFSHVCISSIIPEYYHSIRPDIDRICKEIAAIRGSKDISRSSIMKNVERYRAALDKLSNYYDRISVSVNALAEWTIKDREHQTKDRLWKIAIACITACITAGITAIVCKFNLILNWFSAILSK